MSGPKRGTIDSYFARGPASVAKRAKQDQAAPDAAAGAAGTSAPPGREPLQPQQQPQQQAAKQPPAAADAKPSAFAALMGGAAKAQAGPATQLSSEELTAIVDRNQAAAQAAAAAAAAAGAAPDLAALLTEPSWAAALAAEFGKPYMRGLQDFLAAEWQRHRVFPAVPDVFRALNSCPLDQVRVVVVGQDPYHNDGQAMGLSFSVPKGQAIPSSLQNIHKELLADCGCPRPSHGSLIQWSHQGVLLLNASLTVRAHEANSHHKKGWEQFTEAALKVLTTRRSGLVFLLWGRNAQAHAKGGSLARHHVLTAAHPSGLSANRGFFGCKHFSKTNELLHQSGLPPVHWALSNDGP